GQQRFVAPRRDDDVNFTPTADPMANAVTAPVRRLSTIAREFGHDRIDVLKLDIEGGEYEVLVDLLAAGPLPSQLLVEFHHGRAGRPCRPTAAAIRARRAAGYRLLHQSRRGLEFTFVRTAGGGAR